jgi:RNA polymerase sigma factor (TIGR02999 family)
MPRRRASAEFLFNAAGTRSALAQEQPSESRPPRAMDDWFSATYRELRRLAASVKHVDANATISTSTLVHEAWIKLANSPDLAPESELHFKRLAARVMRQIVMDEARRHRAGKRGGGRMAMFVTLDDSMDVPISCNQDLLRLDAALDALGQISPRQAELVQLRFFGGHDVPETSALLGIAESTAVRDWRVAKAWLAAEIHRSH